MKQSWGKGGGKQYKYVMMVLMLMIGLIVIQLASMGYSPAVPY